MILMTHPDLPDTPPVEVTAKAFRHWSARGWQAVVTETAPGFGQFTHPTYDEEE